MIFHIGEGELKILSLNTHCEAGGIILTLQKRKLRLREVKIKITHQKVVGQGFKPQVFFFFNFVCFFTYLFIFGCWVFISVQGLSLAVASGGHSSSRCTGLSLSRPPLLRSTSSRRAGSVVVAHGPSCSTAYGIFPDQGSNPCPLHWQADSQPLRHQGSPQVFCTALMLPQIWVRLRAHWLWRELSLH